MKLLSIKIANFLSYKDTTNINLADRGLVGVFGANGQGKSSICDSLVWCLWGETVRNVDKDLVVNNKSGKDCKVSLQLEDSGQQFKIVRTRSCTKEKKRNDLRIYTGKEESEITSGTTAASQLLVNSIIGLDFATFVQSVLLSGGDVSSFCRLTDDEKKAVLEDILRINVIRKARDVVKDKISSRNNTLVTLEAELAAISSQREAATKKLQDLQIPFNNFELQQKINIEEIDNLIRNQDKEIDNINSNLELLPVLEKDKKDLEKDLGLEQALITNLEGAHKQNISKLKTVEQDASVNVALVSAEIDKLDKQKINVQNLNGQCPTCLKPTPDKHLTITKLEQELLEAKKRKLEFLELKHTLGQAITKQTNDFNDEILGIANKIKDLTNSIRQKSKVVDTAENLKLILPHVIQRKTDLFKKLNEEKNRDNPYSKLIEITGKEIKDLDNRTVMVKARVRKAKYEISNLRFWDKGFGNQGIKSYIIDNAIPFLNRRAAHYSEIMSNSKIQISFSSVTRLKNGSDREKFNVEIINEVGADMYSGNSSGERRRADVCIGWALADLAATRAAKPIKFRGLDEPFESLDEEGIEAVFRLLNSAINDYETIFCITHDQSLQEKFQRVMLVEKVDGSSRITNG